MLKECAWFFVLEKWDIEGDHLQTLLYYAQGYHLALLGKPLFDNNFLATESGVILDEEGQEVVKEVIYTRDYIQFWLNLAYYFQGYLEYFGGMNNEIS